FNKSDISANKNNSEISTSQSIPSAPKKLFKNIEVDTFASINFDTYSYGLDVVGEFAYVGRLHSLDTINIKDRNNPLIISTFENEKWANKAIAENFYLYLLADYSLTIIDNADPGDPDIISEIDFEGFDPKAILDKDLLYIAASTVSDSNEESILYIVDVTSKKQPLILSSTKLLKPIYGIYFNDGLIYLSGSGVVYIIEPNNISKPKIISELNFDGWLNDIIVRDDIAFTVGNTGLTVWDFSTKKNPVIINTIGIGGYGKKLYLHENQLFIFNNSEDDDNNLLVADISDKNNYDIFSKISNIPIEGYPQNLKVFDGNLFLLCNEIIDYKTSEGTTIANEVKSRLYILNMVNEKN
ncbi:MAG: hypothetical protein ACXWFB_11435, partial [Nitrososphaeraceae archaeon]